VAVAGKAVTTRASAVQYTLFGTSACHLCEVAEAMLVSLCAANPEIGFEKVDISESDQLFERYGVTIPVLRDIQGRELGWPFTVAQLEAFVCG
jgi:hypothetical protein